ncbi:hypothetical protein [Spirosoma foliorum]|uniref:Sel1 repeat family protein n=1 Tax=Spirosoma foliorum TaxID=2710596 RepID=A0A7G5GQD6_9BACT|nr:hypothetical protein [Spirosoma foliorum]QMW01078.1 hypothetical protein H3H32_24310 [Spirosoma foliorum]
MKTLLLGLSSVLGLFTTPAAAPNSAQDLKDYLTIREQIKAMDMAALKKIATSPDEKTVKKGLATYYSFIKVPLPENNPAAGKAAVDALETAANTYMDPIAYVKLAIVYAQDNPSFNIKQDRTKSLKYLSIAWEIADLSDKATHDNALLTLIVNNSLGLGDGFYRDNTNGTFAMKKALDTIRPEVLAARGRFKKLYNLSVKDEFTGSTNVERHYGG